MSGTISKESALEQIEVFLDYYGIDAEDLEIEDGEKAVKTMYNTLCRAIQKGNLEISMDSGDFVMTHNLKFPIGETDKITYTDKVPKAKLAAEKGKGAKSSQNLFMSAMGDVPVSVLTKLKGFDETVSSRIAVVFSMV